MKPKRPSTPVPSRRNPWAWWSVRVLVRCTCDDPGDTGDLWDHSILLVRARSEKEALRKGRKAGRAHQTEYIGGTGFRVRWRLDTVLDAYELPDDELNNGVELYSRLGRGKGRDRPEDPMAGWSASRRLDRELLGK